MKLKQLIYEFNLAITNLVAEGEKPYVAIELDRIARGSGSDSVSEVMDELLTNYNYKFEELKVFAEENADYNVFILKLTKEEWGVLSYFYTLKDREKMYLRMESRKYFRHRF